MKKLGKNTIFYIVMLCIFVVSVALLIVNYTMQINIGVHPLLNFAFLLAIDFGVLFAVMGFIKKSPAYFFLSAPLLALSLTYVLVCCLLPWWLILICALVVLVLISLFSLISAGNKTEDIALNKSTEYKNYEQRKAEKEALEDEKPEEELPQIKSFADKDEK